MTHRTTRCHPRLGLRFRVWASEHELDAALAHGKDPGATEELQLRAERLARPEQRFRLADAIEELLELAGGHEVLANPEALAAATSPQLQLAQIRTSRSALIQLVNRLRDKCTADVQGLAQVRCLLSDDRGPLYHRDASASLDEAVAAAIGGLDRRDRGPARSRLGHSDRLNMDVCAHGGTGLGRRR